MSDNLEINIEEIIQEIRKEIQEKGYKEANLKFSDIPIPAAGTPPVPQGDDLKKILDYLDANYSHDIMLPFQSSNPLAGAIKKVIRRMVRFLFYPVLAQQNAVNSSIVQALNILAAQKETEDGLERTVEDLQERVKILEKELQQLRNKDAGNKQNKDGRGGK